MKKLALICLLVAGCMYPASSFARICFLGDTSCQGGKFEASVDESCRSQDSSWVHEGDTCSGLIYGSPICSDNTGNYYTEGSCPSGYTDVSSLDDKYECKGSLMCNKCCKTEEVECTSEYIECGNNSEGSDSGICQEPDGDVKYKQCECNKNVYSSKCEGAGLEGDYSDVCIDSDGNTWFKSCQCAGGYTQTAYSNIKCSDECKDNCRLGNYIQLPGTSYYCWEGAECLEDPTPEIEQCPIIYQSDFDGFWAGYDVSGDCGNLTVDCDTLGYNTGSAETGRKCKDGTEPYRCPFDHTEVYCASGIAGCDYSTVDDCEKAYFGSTCTEDTNGCYLPTGCKTGYATDVETCKVDDGSYSLGTADAFGCAQCVCKNTCEDTVTTIPDNATAVKSYCIACGQTTQITTDVKCNSGYTTVITCPVCGYVHEGGYSGQSFVCPVCNYSTDKIATLKTCKKDCSGYTLSSCPENGYCDSCNNLYKLNSCKAGYVVSGDTCVESSSSGSQGFSCLNPLAAENEFNMDIIGERLTVVMFGAGWSGPSKIACQTTFITNQLRLEELRLNYLSIDVDEFPNLTTKYGVRSIPTFIIFKLGDEIDRKVGMLNQRQFIDWIETNV